MRTTWEPEDVAPQERSVVTCPRCAGLLIHARDCDEELRWTGYRCPLCGDRIDAVILHHRQLASPPESHREHALPARQVTQVDMGQLDGATEKERNIGIFKSGFGGQARPRARRRLPTTARGFSWLLHLSSP